MEGPVSVSVVIPAFNRGEQIRPTLEALLRSDIVGISPLEIIVVDDGSQIPLDPIVNSYVPPPDVRLWCVRQANSGNSAARNSGFRQASGDIVLFIDHDVVVPADLIKKHVELHGEHPGSVIYGGYRPPDSLMGTPEYEAFISLWHIAPPISPSRAKQVHDEVTCSGNLSVERKMFINEGGVHTKDLRWTEADDPELSYRLRQRGIPTLFAMDATAVHLRSIDIEAVCRWQYERARGLAEVLIACPQFGCLSTLRPLATKGRGIAGTIKGRIASTPIIRQILVYCYLSAKKGRLPRGLKKKLYRLALGASYVAGLRAGFRSES
jgi:glycosyltransferase involved in cell wall biosynthesis